MPKSAVLPLAFAALASAAVAAPDPAPVTRTSVERRAVATFTRADTNHDDYLSKEEYRAAILAVAARRGATPTDKGLAAADAQFDLIDTRHTGRIPRADFIAAAVAHFDGADLNRDGTVTAEEARKAGKIKQQALDEAKRR